MDAEILMPEWALIGAVRYALGRMTYIVGDTADLLIKRWPELSDQAREIIRRDLEEAFEQDDRARDIGKHFRPLGMDMDRAQWVRARKLWEETCG